MSKDKQMRSRRKTVKDLASDLGMSVSTVSRAFYPDAIVADATRRRVLKRAAEIGYRPNPMAQSLITRRSRIVGMVVADLSNPFYPECMSQLSAMLRKAGMQVMLAAADDSEHVDEAVEQLLTYNPDIVIVMAVSTASQAQDACEKAGVQCIFFNRLSDGAVAFGVSCDNAAGGRLVADHLIDTGHQKLAYVSAFPHASTNIERLEGFRTQSLKRGLDAPLVLAAGQFSFDAGYKVGRELGRTTHDLDGVFCANDIVALGFIEGVRKAGTYRVPEDLSVVGFDDVVMARWPSNALTTVAQPVREMMQRTVEMAILLSENNDLLPQVDRLAPGELLVRETTRDRRETRESGQ